jgi:hypothetical protein
LANPLWAQSSLITFDDLPTDTYYQNDGVHLSNTVAVPLAGGYCGLNWNNFYAVDGQQWPASLGQFGAGFQSALISPKNEAITFPEITNSPAGVPTLDNACTLADISSSTAFDLVSGYFTALYCADLNLQVEGFNGANLLYDETYVLQYNDPTYLQFDFNGVTDVHLVSSGGVLGDTTDGVSLKTYGMDNLTIIPAPEPGVLALAGLGGLSILGLRRRHWRRQ